MSVLLIGSQRPTLLHEPPAATDWRLSDIAVEWARDVGGYVLDEWQEWLVRWTFARRRDGLWAARDVGMEVTRQSGKNIVLEVVELAGVFEFKDRLITHSAHRADVSHEHFLSVKERIEGSDELMSKMPMSRTNNGFITTNGNESIALASGARILFKARAKASGRGPRPQKIVFDEALVLDDSQVGSMAPGISAQRNPQVIFASSAPKTESEVLHGLRARAVEDDPSDRLFYAAWNNPPDTDVNDRDAMYRVNPSLGYGRVTEDSLMANRKLMSPAEFLREHLGVPEDPPLAGDGGFDLAGAWPSLTDPSSKIASHHRLALDVAPYRRSAALGAAGRRSDGLLHVEVVEHRPGTGWVLELVVRSWGLLRIPIRIQSGSPAASFIGPLREAGVEVVEVSVGEYAQATGQILDAGAADELRHLAQTSLQTAVSGAVLRETGDVVSWGRRTSKVDITTLVAVTIAAGGVPQRAPSGLFVAMT